MVSLSGTDPTYKLMAGNQGCYKSLIGQNVIFSVISGKTQA